MRLPEFTAEASLYKTGESYIMNGMLPALINDREISPQATGDCYDFNGYTICVPRAYKPWWERWPDPAGMQEIQEMPGIAISPISETPSVVMF